jgi:hypothetical protein
MSFTRRQARYTPSMPRLRGSIHLGVVEFLVLALLLAFLVGLMLLPYWLQG